MCARTGLWEPRVGNGPGATRSANRQFGHFRHFCPQQTNVLWLIPASSKQIRKLPFVTSAFHSEGVWQRLFVQSGNGDVADNPKPGHLACKSVDCPHFLYHQL